jgi:hypothetical protein
LASGRAVAAVGEDRIAVDELIGFYEELPHTVLHDDGPTPLYQRIFLNKARNGFIDDGLLPDKVDGSQLLATFQTSIAVCLQVKERDLERLLPLLPDPDLTFANLSRLFAISRLMRKLKLGAEDYVLLAGLTGIDASASPADTLKLVEAAGDLKMSPLKLADVKFMIEHAASNLADREIKDDRIRGALEKLQEAYQGNFALNRSGFNANLSAEEQKATLQTAARLRDVGEEDVKVHRVRRSGLTRRTMPTSPRPSSPDCSPPPHWRHRRPAPRPPDISAEQRSGQGVLMPSPAISSRRKQAILEQTATAQHPTWLAVVQARRPEATRPASVLSAVLSSDTSSTPTSFIPSRWLKITEAAFLEQFRARRPITSVPADRRL